MGSLDSLCKTVGMSSLYMYMHMNTNINYRIKKNIYILYIVYINSIYILYSEDIPTVLHNESRLPIINECIKMLNCGNVHTEHVALTECIVFSTGLSWSIHK